MSVAGEPSDPTNVSVSGSHSEARQLASSDSRRKCAHETRAAGGLSALGSANAATLMPTGALAGSLSDVGISDKFIKDVREKVTPGTSALFVMTSDAVQDRVAEAFAGANAELLATNLSNEQEEKLREVFAD